MRNRLVGAALSTLVLSACGAPSCGHPQSTATDARVVCPDMTSAHHAYVVVEHMSGAWFESCIGFNPEFIDGQTIMDRSGIEYQAQPVGSTKVVCQIDLEPARIGNCPDETWPRWTVFVEVGARWTLVGSDYAGVRLYDGQAIGWRYAKTSSAGPPPQPRMLGG